MISINNKHQCIIYSIHIVLIVKNTFIIRTINNTTTKSPNYNYSILKTTINTKNLYLFVVLLIYDND